MWKNQKDGTIKTTLNGWTLIIDSERTNNQHWCRIARRSSLVGAQNHPTIEVAKSELETWASTHNYVGNGRIEKA